MLMMIAALKEEIAGVKKCVSINSAIHHSGCHIFRCKQSGKEILLVQTGKGKEKAENVADGLLKEYPIDMMISFGFAGSLTPDLQVGQIVLCSPLSSTNDSPDIYHPDSYLLSRSVEIRTEPVVRQVKSVAVSQTAFRAEEKLTLVKSFQADVVEMESYWLAKIARTKKLPFLAVRAISDTLHEPMPPVERLFNSRGEPELKKAAFYSLLHPVDVPALNRLYRNSRIARKNLTDFLNQLLVKIL
jgi:adenosylhomocysteine nucleosidase